MPNTKLAKKSESCVQTSSTPRKLPELSKGSKERWKTNKSIGRKRKFSEEDMSKNGNLVELKKWSTRLMLHHLTWKETLNVLRPKSKPSLALEAIKISNTQLTIMISRLVTVLPPEEPDKPSALITSKALMTCKSGAEIAMMSSEVIHHLGPEAMIMSTIEWSLQFPEAKKDIMSVEEDAILMLTVQMLPMSPIRLIKLDLLRLR